MKKIASVDEFVEALDHPLKADIEVVRKWIRSVSAEIGEEVKWNAPSYRTATDFFATFHLRSRDAVQLVFHRGAKVKDAKSVAIPEAAAGLVRWLAADRCLVTLGSGVGLKKNKAGLVALVDAWIRQI